MLHLSDDMLNYLAEGAGDNLRGTKIPVV